jgi:predicted phosphodiesterase
LLRAPERAGRRRQILDNWKGRLQHPAARAIVLGILGAVIAVELFSPLIFTVDAFTLRLALRFLGGGQTVVQVPPFGSVAAHTHRGPLGIVVTLIGVDITRLNGLMASFTRAQLVPGLLAAARRDIALAVGWALALSLTGGAALTWIAGERQARRLLGGGSAGLAAVGVAILIAWGSFQPSAFLQPSFTGALQAAPILVSLAQEGFTTVRNFEAQMGSIAGNLATLFAASKRFSPDTATPGEVTVMLVSDIHNNPLGYDLIDRVLPTFRPSFVIDAGDLTDFGTPLESGQLARIAGYGVPYLFTAGNHEKPPEMAELARVKNVVILNGQEVVEDGVGVVGVPDPSSTGPTSQVASAAALASTAATLQTDVGKASYPVSIAVAHNPNVVAPLYGHVPVVVNGHTHSIWVRTQGADVWLNDGTTGAGGIRQVAPEPGPQAGQEVKTALYSLMVVYLDPVGGHLYRAAAVDTVRLSEVQGTLDLQRQVIPSSP